MAADEALGAGALSRRMGLSASRGSRVIDGLVRRGLLLRRVDDEDRRAALVTLSAKGRNVKQGMDGCLSSATRPCARACPPPSASWHVAPSPCSSTSWRTHE